MNTSFSFPLRIEKDHLFATIDGSDWIVDTGAPGTFGNGDSLNLNGTVHPVARDYMGLTAEQVTNFVGFPTDGILGSDVLNHYDMVFNLEHQRLSLSVDKIPVFGTPSPLEEFMGIPIIGITLNENANRLRMFLDTGAKISYLPESSLEAFPRIGEIEDFYPGFGQFKTVTHHVDFTVSTQNYGTVVGSLPTLLNMTLMLAGVDGIFGNEIFKSGMVGYFPRRKVLCL